MHSLTCCCIECNGKWQQLICFCVPLNRARKNTHTYSERSRRLKIKNQPTNASKTGFETCARRKDKIARTQTMNRSYALHRHKATDVAADDDVTSRKIVSEHISVHKTEYRKKKKCIPINMGWSMVTAFRRSSA